MVPGPRRAGGEGCGILVARDTERVDAPGRRSGGGIRAVGGRGDRARAGRGKPDRKRHGGAATRSHPRRFVLPDALPAHRLARRRHERLLLADGPPDRLHRERRPGPRDRPTAGREGRAAASGSTARSTTCTSHARSRSGGSTATRRRCSSCTASRPTSWSRRATSQSFSRPSYSGRRTRAAGGGVTRGLLTRRLAERFQLALFGERSTNRTDSQDYLGTDLRRRP